MEEQEFCLRWSNHEKNMSSVMESMFKKQILVDVTLSCSEGNPVKAHRTVLSACSPYFETLFNDLSHPHPVVFMKDVKNEDLQALLSFMYKGEANVKQNRLNAFIKLAEALSVRGLSKTEKEEVVNPPPPLKEIEKKTTSSFTGMPGLSHMPMFFPNLSLVSDKPVQERYVANSFVEEAMRKRKRLDPEPASGINNNEGSPCSTSEESSPSLKEKSLSAIAAQLHQKKILAEQGNSPFCYPPKLEQPMHTEKPEYLSHENSEELSDVENIVEELHHENRSSPSIKEENTSAGPSTGHLAGVNGAESPAEEKGFEDFDCVSMQERRKPMSFFTWVEMETPDGKKRLRQCLLCGMQVSNATQHLRKHFPGTFTCPYCHMTMKRRYELRQHVITKHPEVAQQT